MLEATPALHGPAVYFDGTSSARNEVTVALGGKGLGILGGADRDRPLDEWAYAELRRMSAPEGVLRLARRGETLLARLEIRDRALIEAIEDRAEALDRGGTLERQLRRKVVALSFAAAASLVVTAAIGLPALANRLLPLVPLAVEHRLGAAIDKNIRASLDSGHLGAAFACGTAPGEAAGRAALDRLVGKLEAAAALPMPLRVEVVRRAEPNAMALPGGHVYVDEGLIAKADTPDELAGVLAHEIGHVAHRDGTRTVLQTAGLSFLFGMMLGDFVGGGAVVIAARTVLKSSYSRRVEAAADAYSVTLMEKAGGDPRALGVILAHIVGDKQHGMKLLLDHPETKDRIAAIDALAVGGATAPLLDAADWNALKQICAPLPVQDGATGSGQSGRAAPR
ncbi:MAG TPA: M48 family metallopeptidase [Stellaceae bacterium]|nr:M48 family metallopeptidase [Stellaceae bacterium]